MILHKIQNSTGPLSPFQSQVLFSQVFALWNTFFISSLDVAYYFEKILFLRVVELKRSDEADDEMIKRLGLK